MEPTSLLLHFFCRYFKSNMHFPFFPFLILSLLLLLKICNLLLLAWQLCFHLFQFLTPIQRRFFHFLFKNSSVSNRFLLLLFWSLAFSSMMALNFCCIVSVKEKDEGKGLTTRATKVWEREEVSSAVGCCDRGLEGHCIDGAVWWPAALLQQGS